MAIIVPLKDDQEDGGWRGERAREDKRRRDLAATIAALEFDEAHRRNIDDAAAKRAYVAYSDQAAAALHGDDGLFYRDGTDAHDAFPAVAAGLADAHHRAITPLTPTQRAIVAAALDDRLRQDLARAGGHVREQGAIEQRRQSLALQRAAARDAVLHVDDPDLYDHHLATGENAIRQQGRIDQLSAEEVDRQLADYGARVDTERRAALAARNSTPAEQWYGRLNLDPVDRDPLIGAAAFEATPVDDRSDADADLVDGTGAITPPAITDGTAAQKRTTQSVVSSAGGAAQRKRAIPKFSPEAIARNRAQAEVDLQNPHFRALMTLIGRYEGSDNPNIGNGYYTINKHLKKGDGLKDLSRFPTELGDRAVGRYQMQQSTSYAYAAPALGITSFQPHDQDLMAAYIIRRRGMFDALSAGDFKTATPRIHRIWVSFPKMAGMALPQQQVTFEDFIKDYQAELAKIQEGAAAVQPPKR